ncbi:MAG: hypothetical protein K8R79_05330, partial [Calditrichales bacterium]|nr:hypothetical protein [Calditrichales bacterium]
MGIVNFSLNEMYDFGLAIVHRIPSEKIEEVKDRPDEQAVTEHPKCHFERSEKSYNVNKNNIPTIRVLQNPQK